MSEYKKSANAEVTLTCTVEGDKWQNAQDKAFKKLAKNVEIKGFRKGQAPLHMIHKALPEGRIWLEAADALAQSVLEEALKEHNVELIDRPQLKLDDANAEKLVLTFVCPVKPDVEIENYKGLGYHEEEAVVTDEDVEGQIKAFLESKAELELKEDGEVEEGDTAVIDYEGFLDGVAFDGGKDENYSLVIGSHSFIPGFEEQLVGMKSEETKEIKVTFPEDYHAENLAGKEVTFKVTVHEIKMKVLPELTDELVEEAGIKDVHTVSELREYLKNGMTQQRQRENATKARNELFDKLNEIAKIDVPEVMIEDELNGMVNEYERQFTYQQQGLSLNNELRNMLKANLKDEATKRVRISLIIEEIGKRENVEVSDEEVEAEFNKLAEEYGMKVEDVKRSMPASFLKSDIRDRKTLDILKQD